MRERRALQFGASKLFRTVRLIVWVRIFEFGQSHECISDSSNIWKLFHVDAKLFGDSKVQRYKEEVSNTDMISYAVRARAIFYLFF